MDKITIKINGNEYAVDPNQTVLQVCKEQMIDIPTLCHLDGIEDSASCSLCMVEIQGAPTLKRACVTPVRPGMDILTQSKRVRVARRVNMELLLANHPTDCLTCVKNDDCELREMSHKLGVESVRFPRIKRYNPLLDSSSAALVRDKDKCILCGRCISVCHQVQGVGAIQFTNRGMGNEVGTFMGDGLADSDCINCGQCVLVCPTGAIVEKSEIADVWASLNDPEKIVIVETAPAIRVAIAECFGMPAGTLATGKMAAALRRLGFNHVFDTQFSADLTIMEEGYELITRIKEGGILPLITSCSPGWVKFAERFFPKALDHVSSCKSPQQMFGAIAKTYYAEKLNVDPRKLAVVSIMPCTAKKFEAKRPEMDSAFHYWKDQLSLTDQDHFQDVDHVLTTREIGRMIKEAGINFLHLPNEDFDQPLGISTGAATIFAATGGVMEAALRTAYEVLTGKGLENIDFHIVRGLEGIKEAEVDIDGLTLKVAIASGLKNARTLLEEVEAGSSPYHFIEIMACPGGCINGGGQPFSHVHNKREERIKSIYIEDSNLPLRKSHDNPAIKELYELFLKEPLGERSHHLLHTHYRKREYGDQ